MAVLIAISSVLVILVLAVSRLGEHSLNFSLCFNIYALLSFCSALIDIGSIYLVLRKRRFTSTTNWFLLFLAAAALMALAEGLQRSSLHIGAALFWQNLSYAGLALLPPAFYLFIVSYASEYKRQFVLLSSVLMLTWGLIAFFAGSGLLFVHGRAQVYHAPWGYASAATNAEAVTIAWFVLFYILGAGLLAQLRKTTQNKLIKKQAFVFILAFWLPFLAALVTNVILPTVAPNVVPPLATLVGAIVGLVVIYAMRKYRLFDLDPQIIAQNILDTMSEAVIITRLDTSIESINPEAERLLGVAADEAVNQKLRAFFSESAWRPIAERIDNKPSANDYQPISESEVKRSDGGITPVRITVTSLEDAGEKMASIFVLSDISEITKSFEALQTSTAKVSQQNEELKKLEAQLRQEKAGVEHTVEIRTKELTDTQAKLKAADQLKTEFIMLTSHNLRTPLAIARDYAEMLTQRPIPNEKAVIDGLQVGLKRLGEFVEDLLAISSLEAGDQSTLEEVPLKQVIDPLIQETEDFARTRGDKFVVKLEAGNVKIKANTNRLQGAIRNLLTNACKYTTNGTVGLSTKRSKDKLLIIVSDTGVGIVASEITRLFTKFHRVNNALTGSSEGEGIGLYLCKLIIDEHGGKISVVSKPNKGSTFTIELPCY